MANYYQNPNIGWECPRCHKINSPMKDSCDCVPDKYQLIPQIPYSPTTVPVPNYFEPKFYCITSGTVEGML